MRDSSIPTLEFAILHVSFIELAFNWEITAWNTWHHHYILFKWIQSPRQASSREKMGWVLCLSQKTHIHNCMAYATIYHSVKIYIIWINIAPMCNHFYKDAILALIFLPGAKVSQIVIIFRCNIYICSSSTAPMWKCNMYVPLSDNNSYNTHSKTLCLLFSY